MKKLLLTVLSLLAYSAFSQTEQGKFLIGAYSSLNSSISKTTYDSSDEEATQSSFGVGLKGGYFLIDHLNLGVQVTYQTSKLKYEISDYKSTNNYLGIAPYARYYFLKGNIKPYFETSFGLGKTNTKTTSEFTDEVDSETTFTLFNLGGGIAIFLHKIISLDLGLNYGINDFENDNLDENDSKTETFTFRGGFSLYF